MKTKEEGNDKGVYMIPFTSKFRALLLAEVAQSRNLECWLEAGNRWEVNICADEEDVRSAIEAAQGADKLLHVRQLEALAMTIQGIDEKPSDALMEAIALARHRAGLENNGNFIPARWDRDSIAKIN